MARFATSTPAFRRLVPFTLVVAVALSTGARAANRQSRLAKEQARYQSENDPVRKAKILAKLGAQEMEAALRQLKAGHNQQALNIVSQYRDQVRDTTHALLATGRNAVRHPAGFKQLQIGVRQCIGRLDDMILEIPVRGRPWFRAVRTDLQNSQNALIDALFPSVGKVAARNRRSRFQ